MKQLKLILATRGINENVNLRENEENNANARVRD